MSELRKPFLKKSDKKIRKKNRKSMSKYRMRTKKPLARKENLIHTKN